MDNLKVLDYLATWGGSLWGPLAAFVPLWAVLGRCLGLCGRSWATPVPLGSPLGGPLAHKMAKTESLSKTRFLIETQNLAVARDGEILPG